MNLSTMISKFISKADSAVRARNPRRPPPDENIHRFNKLRDMTVGPVNTNDYNVPLLDRKPVEPTHLSCRVSHTHPDQPAAPERANVGPGGTTNAVESS